MGLEELWQQLMGGAGLAWGDPTLSPPRLHLFGISPPQPSNSSCVKSELGRREWEQATVAAYL